MVMFGQRTLSRNAPSFPLKSNVALTLFRPRVRASMSVIQFGSGSPSTARTDAFERIYLAQWEKGLSFDVKN